MKILLPFKQFAFPHLVDFIQVLDSHNLVAGIELLMDSLAFLGRHRQAIHHLLNIRICARPEIRNLREFAQTGSHGRPASDKLLCVRILRMHKQVAYRVLLHDFALVHHDSAVGDFSHHPQVVGDEEHTHTVFLLQDADEREDVLLDSDIKSGGRFVGDEQLRIAAHGHGNHDTLFLSAGEFVRVRVEKLLRTGQQHLFEEIENLFFSLFFRNLFVQQNLFGDLLAAPDDRIERGHRFLENHPDLVAPDRLHHRLLCRQHIHGRLVCTISVKEDAAGRITGNASAEQTHDGQCRDGLTRARFPDNTQRFPLREGETDMV